MSVFLESPNPEDSRFIKMAIVGFSYHEETECWARDHFEVAHDYLCESGSIGASDAMKLYSMLALGALLGMHTSGKIDTSTYRTGHATLPGFTMAKGGAVDELPS